MPERERNNPFVLVDERIRAEALARVRGNAEAAERLRSDSDTALSAIAVELGDMNGEQGIDFARITSIAGDAGEKVEKIVELHSNLAAAVQAVGELRGISRMEQNVAAMMAGASDEAIEAAIASRLDPSSVPSLSACVAQAQGGTLDLSGVTRSRGLAFDGLDARAAIFQTSDGMPPPRPDSGRIGYAQRLAPSLIDSFGPPVPWSTNAYPYFVETFTGDPPEERAEGAAATEQDIALARTEAIIQSIAGFIPVTEEQLADAGAARAYLDNRLMYRARRRLNSQLANGTGTSPQIQGLLDGSAVVAAGGQVTSGLSSAGGYSPLDDIRTAIARCYTRGEAQATGVWINPNEWANVETTKASGMYVFGSPALAAQPLAWGRPVFESVALRDASAANRIWAAAGDFIGSADLVLRQDALVEVGWNADDFSKVQLTIRVTLRVAVAWYVPGAFSYIKTS